MEKNIKFRCIGDINELPKKNCWKHRKNKSANKRK
jgi:hypothetical protein